MSLFYMDLHVHIGRSSSGHYVKIPAAANLTFGNIAHEALHRKGIDIIGVVDCISPHVLKDIDELISLGELEEMSGGGFLYHGRQTLLTGAEIETNEEKGGSAHTLCYFPSLELIKAFSHEMSKYMNNIHTNCLASRLTAQQLYDMVESIGGIYIPAHVFTPHKSFYGTCCSSMLQLLDEKTFTKIPAVELGLSSDTAMASQLQELDGKVFLTNSDAHSLPKIGREYNAVELEIPDFSELLKAFKGIGGRRMAANYGLDPRLGKYHRSYCDYCETILKGEPPVLECPVSGIHRITIGVRDRLELIKSREVPEKTGRPPYNYQIPLEFLPGLGPKTTDRLINYFGSEMNILHKASLDELKKIVKEDLAERIVAAREGRLSIDAGGGGFYGRIGH